MGMSASQARLLGITSRMNDIEFKSQQISNMKIRLADDSEKVAHAYPEALNKQKFTMTSFASGKAVKTDVTIASLNAVGSTMKLCARNGKQVISKSQANAYKAAINSYNTPHYSWTTDTHENHFNNLDNASILFTDIKDEEYNTIKNDKNEIDAKLTKNGFFAEFDLGIVKYYVDLAKEQLSK